MLKSKSLKILLLIVTMVAILGVSSDVFATGTVPTINTNALSPIPTLPSGSTTTTNTNTTGTTNTNTTNTANGTSVYGNTNTTSTSSNLPKTGVDYSIVFIILACVVFAIFAYKKIKEYNEIKY